MKNAKRLLLCLAVFSAVMLCTAYAFVQSPTPCEHPIGTWQADGDDCLFVCDACGEKLVCQEHCVSCITGACVNCGATGVTGYTSHIWSAYQYDETEHWQYCTDCGEELYRDTHWVSCATGACVDCGATGVTGYTSHTWGDYQYDDTEHWVCCPDCGEEISRNNHWAYCTEDGDACASCGATGVTVELSHSWGSYSNSDTEHWRTCNECGTEIREGHAVYCMNEWCTVCGASGVQGDADHTIHFLNCTTGVCGNCGQSGVQGEISHDNGSNYQHDATKHWLCRLR